MNDDDLLSAAKMAELLADAVPDRDEAGWAQWLANNRNPARETSYRIRHERLAGRVYYRRSALNDFVDFERQRHLGTIKLTGRTAELVQALGLRQPGASGTGRPFNLTSLTHHVDAEGREFAQLVLGNPLMVFRLEPMDCAALYQALGDVIEDFTAHNEYDD